MLFNFKIDLNNNSGGTNKVFANTINRFLFLQRTLKTSKLQNFRITVSVQIVLNDNRGGPYKMFVNTFKRSSFIQRTLKKKKLQNFRIQVNVQIIHRFVARTTYIVSTLLHRTVLSFAELCY